MTARENVVPVLLEKVYQLIQDKLELSDACNKTCSTLI